MFPASCPFVTSVGGTTRANPEIAASFSSGSCSDLFLQPNYHADAVNRYLDGLEGQWAGLFNPQGRDFPRIAAQAVNYSTYDDEASTQVKGTLSERRFPNWLSFWLTASDCLHLFGIHLCLNHRQPPQHPVVCIQIVTWFSQPMDLQERV